MQEAGTQAKVRPGKLKRFLALLLLIVILWGCVIAYWVVRQSVPGIQQMVLGLGVIPGAVVLLWFVSDMLKDALDKKQSQQAITQQQSALMQEQTTEMSKPVQLGRLNVLGVSCCLPAGLDSDTALPDSLLDIPYPALHPSLRDSDGLPIKAAWVELDDYVDKQGLLAPHEARILVLVEKVTEILLPQLHEFAWQTEEEIDTQVVAGLRKIESTKTVPSIKLWIYLDGDSSAHLEQRLLEQTNQKLADFGLSDAVGEIELVHQATTARVWQDLENLAHRRRSGCMPVEIFMAAGSQISSQLLQSSAFGQRRTQSADKGDAALGEGAAGVIFLQDLNQAGNHSASTQLLGPLTTQVDKQALVSAKISEMASLIQYFTQEIPRLANDSSLAAIHDSNMGSGLAVEATQALAIHWPDLSHAKQVLALASHIGKQGAVAPLAQIAIATTQMHYSPNPVILLSLENSGKRFAMALRAVDVNDVVQGSAMPEATQ